MKALTDSHLFRLGLFAVGLAVAPVTAQLLNLIVLDGQLTPLFSQIRFHAWLDLSLTAGIPLFLLGGWCYLLPFVPQAQLEGPQGKAHANAIVLSAVFVTFLTAWSHTKIWISTDPQAALRFLLAPFATISLEILLYVVVFSLSFKISSIGQPKQTRKKILSRKRMIRKN